MKTADITISDELRYAFNLLQLIKQHPSLTDITKDQLNKKDRDKSMKDIENMLQLGGEKRYGWFQDDEGKTVLHHAAQLGHLDICKVLVSGAAHPWNAQDDRGMTAAECALLNGHTEVYEWLLAEAVRSEMLLGILERQNIDSFDRAVDDTRQPSGGDDQTVENSAKQSSTYLSGDVIFEKGLLRDSVNNDGVMMEWERPLMKLHARKMVFPELSDQEDHAITVVDCPTDTGMVNFIADILPLYKNILLLSDNVHDGDEDEEYNVLNVGFGMGLIDSYLHQYLLYKISMARKEGKRLKCRHYIIEAHPQVLQQMQVMGWLRDNEYDSLIEIIVLEGKWQDKVEELYANGTQFNAIFFDTFGESYEALREWHEHVGNLLLASPNSVYSYFNGLGGSNPFFNHIYRNIVEVEMEELGLHVAKWKAIPMNPAENGGKSDTQRSEEQENSEWSKVNRRYFSLQQYHLPICKWRDL